MAETTTHEIECATVTGPTADAFNLPGNLIAHGIAKYGEKDQDGLLWLAAYTRNELHGSRSELERLLDFDWSVIYRVYSGTYPASIDNFMAAVRHLREKVAHQTSAFAETPVTKRMWQALDYARKYNTIMLICGPARRGKTEAAKEWKRRAGGRVYYIYASALGGVRPIIHALAKQLGINYQTRKTSDTVERIKGSLSWKDTLIIDEASHLIQTSTDMRPLELLRELNDTCGCGIALVATRIFDREMEQGRMAIFLEQLSGRIEQPVVLPEKVGRGEVESFCRLFTQEPGSDLVTLATKISNTRGRIGKLFILLRQAAEFARLKNVPITAELLQAACDVRDNLYTAVEA